MLPSSSISAQKLSIKVQSAYQNIHIHCENSLLTVLTALFHPYENITVAITLLCFPFKTSFTINYYIQNIIFITSLLKKGHLTIAFMRFFVFTSVRSMCIFFPYLLSISHGEGARGGAVG
jgi:hypothetical protein